MSIDHFHVLGLQPGCSLDQIKRAWRDKCKEHHPDIGGNPAEFRRVTHAYKMLTDPSYNRDRSGREHNLNFIIQRAINFSDAFFGTTLIFGYGRVEYGSDMKPVNKPDIEPVTFTLNIPPGTTGFQHIEPGMGIKMGDSVGAAIVNVMVGGHPKFRLEGMDTVSKEPIPLDVMLTGGKIEVLTMYGLKSCKVMPGTRPNDKLLISKAGVMEIGNHIVLIEPVYPSIEEFRQPSWHGLEVDWKLAEVEEAEKQDAENIKFFESSNSGGN